MSDHGWVGEPTWFGPADAPLFGVVHSPAGGLARGGVVICPPLGKEHVDTYRGLKLLAQQLASNGFAVLRFDYLGTGDSARDQGSDSAIEDCNSSVDAAVEYLRRCGAQNISLIGLRVGALFAGLAAPAVKSLEHLVLWDPVTDGRRYLREQRVLYKMTVGEDVIDVGNEPILGLTLSTAAAQHIKSLTLPEQIDPAGSTLLLARPERMDDSRLHAIQSGSNCTVESASQQAAFVEPKSFVVQIPVQSVDVITAWFDAKTSRATAEFTPVIQRQTVIASLSGGEQIVETIDQLGPNRLFGIRTAVAGTAPNTPTLLMHGTACDHRIGAGRIWTETARDVAGLGMAALRYDRRGTGDTGITTTTFPRIYSDSSKQDIADAVDATGVTPDRLIVTGVCSGAWSAAYAGIVKGAKSVVLVNVILYALRNVEVGPEKLIGMTPQNPGAAPPPELFTFKARTKNLIRRLLPYWAWLGLGRLGVAQVPEVLLDELRRMNVTTDMVMSPADVAWFEKQRGGHFMARMADTTWAPTMIPAPTGDHPLLQRDIQNFTRMHLRRAITRDFDAVLVRPGMPGKTITIAESEAV